MTEYADEELIAQFKEPEKKEQAFRMIVARYQQKIYRMVRKIVLDHNDTDDILQNTFIRAWQGLEQFREQSQLFTWLYRIAVNESISFLNKKKKRSFVAWDDVENTVKDTLASDEYFTGDEARRKLECAIAGLPDKQRVVFNLKYFEEMPYEEMSQVLQTSVGALKASYHHAVKKVEKYLING